MSNITRWSLSDDFSTIHNPNTVWSYGSKPAGYQVSGAFSLFTHLDPDPKSSGIVAWFAVDNFWQLFHYLGVYFNPNQQTITLSDKSANNSFGDGITEFAPNSVGMAPGTDGRFAVTRFIAPIEGNYTLNVSFSHTTNTYNTSSISQTGGYIVHNDRVTLWETAINGIGDSKTFISPWYGVHIRENDTIDFIVGIGQDNSIEFELTMVGVEIKLLPETNTSTTTITETPKNQTNTNHNVFVIAILLGAILGLIICTIVAYLSYRFFKKRKIVTY
ncbi:27161_t:CDS:1, partial [Dentiscutata erythropus]